MKSLTVAILLTLVGGCAGNQQASKAAEPDGVMANDHGLKPVNSVFPEYPKGAARRGLSGDCVVEFTVTEEGMTKDHSILWCSHSAFENASIKAAENLVYSPVVIEGKAVEVSGVQYSFQYDVKR